MREIAFTDIEGSRIRHAEDLKAATGATVSISEAGVIVGVDVRGGAPGTRETDLLNPVNLVDKVHAVLLAGGNLFSGNTTIGVVATNAALTTAQATKLASMAHDGYARTMRPAHSMVDGDTIFAMSTGPVGADLSFVGLLAARVMERAIVAAVKNAEPLCGYSIKKDPGCQHLRV